MSAHRYTVQFAVTLTPERISAQEWQSALNERKIRDRLRRVLLGAIPLQKGEDKNFDIEFREQPSITRPMSGFDVLGWDEKTQQEELTFEATPQLHCGSRPSIRPQ